MPGLKQLISNYTSTFIINITILNFIESNLLKYKQIYLFVLLFVIYLLRHLIFHYTHPMKSKQIKTISNQNKCTIFIYILVWYYYTNYILIKQLWKLFLETILIYPKKKLITLKILIWIFCEFSYLKEKFVELCRLLKGRNWKIHRDH